jgi:hypothetical protein
VNTNDSIYIRSSKNEKENNANRKKKKTSNVEEKKKRENEVDIIKLFIFDTIFVMYHIV